MKCERVMDVIRSCLLKSCRVVLPFVHLNEREALRPVLVVFELRHKSTWAALSIRFTFDDSLVVHHRQHKRRIS